MHNCLTVPEILAMIFDIVAGEPTFRRTLDGPYRDLAVLARTCKLFSAPALDLLWHTLSDISPLVRCMPTEVWTQKVAPPTKHSDDDKDDTGHHTTQRKIVSFLRQPKESDWQRVLAYVKKVKVLSMSRIYSVKVEVQCAKLFQDSWQRSYPGQQLLPNLKVLNLDDNDTLYAALLATPGLKSLGMRLRTTADTEIMQSLASKCPLLDTIDFAPEPLDRYVQQVSRAVCEWRNLFSVEVGALDRHALAYLSTVPTLVRLSTIGVSKFEAQAAYESIVIDPFPRLTSFTTNDKLLLENGLASFSLPHLEELIVLDDTFCTAREWAIITQNIVDAFSPSSSLSSLTVRDNCIHPMARNIDAEDYAIPISVLEPLLPYCRLTYLALNPAGGFDLGDEDLARMARAWPLLEHLSLAADLSMTGWMKAPRITILGLLPLIQNCRRLENLAIVIDARVLPPRGTRLDVDADAESTIDYVFLGNSLIEEPVGRVAALLADLFPNLRDISAWWDEDMESFFEGDMGSNDADDYSKMWADAAALIPEFTATRRHERQRIAAMRAKHD
ncbi:hypothetical protein PLICRDRAFT_169754 [Plicaturopsis crispa FD-325 SS-3]|nr:hypothetical protein PLICRDRAFT_169754 [Plicaturopsis crispa FD-325 SS-3]